MTLLQLIGSPFIIIAVTWSQWREILIKQLALTDQKIYVFASGCFELSWGLFVFTACMLLIINVVISGKENFIFSGKAICSAVKLNLNYTAKQIVLNTRGVVWLDSENTCQHQVSCRWHNGDFLIFNLCNHVTIASPQFTFISESLLIMFLICFLNPTLGR